MAGHDVAQTPARRNLLFLHWEHEPEKTATLSIAVALTAHTWQSAITREHEHDTFTPVLSEASFPTHVATSDTKPAVVDVPGVVGTGEEVFVKL